VRNGRVDIEGGRTPRGVLSIARRSAATLLHFSGLRDIQRIDLTTLRDGVGYRLAYIRSDFQAPRREPFDSAYMRALYDDGFAFGQTGTDCRDIPPNVGTIATPGLR